MAVRPFDPPAPKERGAIVSIWGEEKKGKTHVAFTFPAPVHVINLDYGYVEPLAKFPDKDIKVASFPLGEEYDTETWPGILQDLRDTYHCWLEAMDGDGGGTIVIDTATQLWQLVQKVGLEEVRLKRLATARKKDPHAQLADQPIYPYDYASANFLMSGLIRRAFQYPRVNLVLIHRAQEIYEGKDPSGRMKCHGFGEVPAIVQANVRLFTEVDKETGVVTRKLRVDSCRADTSFEGRVMAEPRYELIAAMLGRD
jgi:hypothetical protein